MKCPECESENREGAKFCHECGYRLDLKCPGCGTINRSSARFCDECGCDLKAPITTTPIDYAKPRSYTPKHLKDKILTTRGSIEGERKLVTVFFADVANYTSISEKLDPEEVHQIMDGCFKILMDEIHKYEGTINQFTGDGVMALFGAPVAHEDHAQRACKAALAVQRSVEEYGEKIKKETGLEFKMRIGLNSGPVIVGSIGDDLRMDYTAVGDTTNVAARMESAARPGSILVSGNTYRIVRHYFEFQSLDKMKVKGKEEPQEAFELIAPSGAETRFEASMAKGLTRFVGRQNSMAILMGVWEKARSGSGQVVGIIGEAGVGKSRILLEFRYRLPQDEFTYLEGQCLRYGENIIYGPIKDIVKTYFDIEDGDREFIIKKKIIDNTYELDEAFGEASLPVFQDFLSVKVDDEDYVKLEPPQKREKTFEAIRDLFIRISHIKPLIIAIEDLHWIDKTSEEFMDYLIEWIAKTPIMLTLLYRTEYRHQWGSKTYYNRIGLDHLGTESSTELVKAMLEDSEIAPELRNLILERAAGNPLFMEEFTYSLKESGTIKRENDRYVLSRDISELDVPDTIQGIIAARMDRLEENLKRTMQVASVIGRDFAFRILQTITGMKQELKTYLLHLQGLEFVYEKQLFPELEYIFKHALTQEVAYNSLLSIRRKEIHKNIGQAIEELYSERLEDFYEIIAHHYASAEENENAARYLRLSGEKAIKSHAPWEAYNSLRQAIEILNRLPESEQVKEELLKIIELMRIPAGLIGFPEGSSDIFQFGERLAKESGDMRRLSVFYNAMGSLYTFRGNHLMAVKYNEDAFEAAKKLKDLELMIPLAYSLGLIFLGTGQLNKFAVKYAEIIDMMEQAGKKDDYCSLLINPYVFLCGICALGLCYAGDFKQANSLMEKCLRQAAECSDPTTLGTVEACQGFLSHIRGEWLQSKEYFEKAIKLSQEAGWTMGLVLMFGQLGYACSILGDPVKGKDFAEKGLQIYSDSGIEYMLPLNKYLFGEINLHLGEIKEAYVFMEEALDLSRRNHEKGWEGLAWIGLGKTLGLTGTKQKSEVEDCFYKGLKILEDMKMKTYYAQGKLFLGEYYLNAGDKEKGIENLKKAESLFREMGITYWLEKTRDLLK